MKQRASVKAIITNDKGGSLFLRRSNGRQSIVGQYELPGGKVAYKEQPEDALRRYLHEDAGLHVDTARLYDVVTYIDHDDRDIQYVVIVYMVTIAEGHHPITLSQNYDNHTWSDNSNIQQYPITDLTELLMGIVQQDTLTDENVQNTTNIDVHNASKNTTVVYSDGGSRGNPGPSAAGFVILDADGQVIEKGGIYLGITTNNQAEYHGVRIGLEKALELGRTRIDFRIDSMLVVNQMNGLYKIKNRELWPINERIRSLVNDFESVTFSHVHREFNQLADAVVNQTLDAHARAGK